MNYLKIPQYKVSQFIEKIKTTLEEHINTIDIIGEVVEVHLHQKSGHCYFKLKEDTDSIACVCWKNYFGKYAKFVQAGLYIRIRAKPSIYKNTNVYVSVYYISLHGEGSILQYKKELAAKLEQEGIFDNKKTIPSYPQKIGLITSKDGAALQDIRKTLTCKFPCKIMLYNVNVQGEESVPNIIQAIQIFNQQEQPVDVIIITRGGGSSEDLFHFNDEALVREVAKSNIPVITAIGHETDQTLVDLAADSYRHTPTASVDFLINKADLLDKMVSAYNACKLQLKHYLTHKEQDSKLLRSQIKHPNDIIFRMQDKIVETERRCISRIQALLRQYGQLIEQCRKQRISSIEQYLTRKASIVQGISIKQYKIQVAIDAKIHQFKLCSHKIVYMPDKINEYQNRLAHCNRLMNAISMFEYLKKGFSILYKKGSKDAKIISSVRDIENGEYTIEMQDGTINILITKCDSAGE